MGKLLDGLRAYMENTSEEQLKKDWDEIKEFDHVGPTVEEYLEVLKGYENKRTEEVI